jgi:hypothetical protein
MTLWPWLQQVIDHWRWPEGTYRQQLEQFAQIEIEAVKPLELPAVQPLKAERRG